MRISKALLLGLLACLPALAAADTFDVFHCKSGTFTVFHQSKELPPVSAWAENGIFLSAGDNETFHGTVTHCEGYNIGRANSQDRYGDGVCTLVDPDGDIVLVSVPYKGLQVNWRFLQGTGKWKGITGSVTSEWAAAGKRAMPGTYQRCSRLKGSFQLAR